MSGDRRIDPDDLDLVDDDIVCRECGSRSGAGYLPTTEPCWSGGSTDSSHSWVRADRDASLDDFVVDEADDIVEDRDRLDFDLEIEDGRHGSALDRLDASDYGDPDDHRPPHVAPPDEDADED